MAYRIYRYDDPGAVAMGLPRLPNPTGVTLRVSDNTALATILDAVLVNGYAGKPGAGWTKPFASDGTLHLYLSGSATGAAIRIDPPTLADQYTITVFSNPPSLTTNNFVGWNTIRAGSKTGGAWVILADEKSFILLGKGDSALNLSSGEWNMHYFGEMTNFENVGTPLSFGHIGSLATSSYSLYPGVWNSLVRDTSAFSNSPPTIRITHSIAATGTMLINGGPFFRGQSASDLQVPLTATGGKILASDVFLTTNNNLLCKLRGLKTLESALWGTPMLDTLSLDGKKYAILYANSTPASNWGGTNLRSNQAMFLAEVE